LQAQSSFQQALLVLPQVRFLAGACANAEVTAKSDTRVAIANFMIFPL
jgi:hypothetical protein